MIKASIEFTPEILADIFNQPVVDSAPTPVQLDTREEASVVNSNSSISPPPEMTVISSPLTDPDNPNFFFLSSNSDAVELAPGSLDRYPGGLLALDNNDYINGSADSEIIRGDRGADTLVGGDGNDTLSGGKDLDYLLGGFGSDVLNGERDSDRLYGNEGNDVIRGGKGDDELVGGIGNDTLVGDKGADVFVLESGSEDLILDYDAAEGDAIALRGLTSSDVVLREEIMTIDSGISAPETTNVTVISELDSGNILGLVKATSSEQLQFV